MADSVAQPLASIRQNPLLAASESNDLTSSQPRGGAGGSPVVGETPSTVIPELHPLGIELVDLSVPPPLLRIYCGTWNVGKLI